MRTYPYSLKANVPVIVDKVGNFIRCVKGADKFVVTADNDGKDVELEFMQWWKRDEAFKQLQIVSKVDQVVHIKIGYGFFGDDRMGGAIDVNGLLSVVNSGGLSYGEKITPLVAATPVDVMTANSDRIAATFVADVSGVLWHDNTVSAAKGIPYNSGSLVEVKNTAALYFYPAANGTAHVLEDLK